MNKKPTDSTGLALDRISEAYKLRGYEINEILPFNKRLMNVLLMADIYTKDDLRLAVTDGSIKKIPNVGSKSIKEIHKFLNANA